MKKIGLCYREFLVGILEYDGENFIYNSNVENEKLADLDDGFMFYDLHNSVNKKMKELPDIFDSCKKELLENREIIDVAGIKEEDGLFERMLKYAELDQIKISYHLKVVD